MGRGLSDLQQRILAEVKKRGGLTYKEAYKLFSVKIPAVKYSKENWKEWRRLSEAGRKRTGENSPRHGPIGKTRLGQAVVSAIRNYQHPMRRISGSIDAFRRAWVNIPVLSTRTHKA